MAAVSLAVLMAGCGQHESDGSQVVTAGGVTKAEAATPKVFTENWPSRVPSAGLTKGMALPLEQYMVSYADEIAVQRARDVAEIACMRRYGFVDWRTEDLGTSPPPADNASNMPRRYGLTVLAEAQEFGYRVPASGRDSTPPPEQDEPDAEKVWRGAEGSEKATSFKGRELPEGGCSGEVDRKVGSLDVELVEQLSAESFERSQQVPAVKAAMARWADCMNARGHDVKTVWDAGDLASANAPTASSKEISIATAEVECKEKTDLVKVWYTEESAIQKQLIASHTSLLDRAQKSSKSTLEAAPAVRP
ncbi:hypothetical protein [Streptomyces sp. cmx-18-6]|uniref:hypothetical protein n=1 Tax=Streptomyces sp. cmx-18-6 TaxID=2790930 RepID=UPI00397EADB8